MCGQVQPVAMVFFGLGLGGVVLGHSATRKPYNAECGRGERSKTAEKGREMLKTPSELVLDEINYHQIPSQKRMFIASC